MTLEDLSQVIQATMNWSGEHLHGFLIPTGLKTEPFLHFSPVQVYAADLDDGRTDMVRLSSIIRNTDTFTYIYDYGNNWEHKITVEKRLEDTEGLYNHKAVLITGRGNFLPENDGESKAEISPKQFTKLFQLFPEEEIIKNLAKI